VIFCNYCWGGCEPVGFAWEVLIFLFPPHLLLSFRLSAAHGGIRSPTHFRFPLLKIPCNIPRYTHPFQPGIYACTPAMRARWGLGRWLELREQFTQALPSRLFGYFLGGTRKYRRRQAPQKRQVEVCGFLDSRWSLEMTVVFRYSKAFFSFPKARFSMRDT